MIMCMIRYMDLLDGKASIDDIQQTLGGSSWHMRMSIISEVCPLVLMQELAMKVNKMERSCHPSVFLNVYFISEPTWQGTAFERSFGVGCLRQIRGRITTSLAKCITVALPHGLLKAMSLGNGY